MRVRNFGWLWAVISIAVFAAEVGGSAVAYGQTPAAENRAVDTRREVATAASANDESGELQKVEAIRQRIAQLEERSAERAQKIVELEIEQLQNAAIQEESAAQQRLSFYGFFDTSFHKNFLRGGTSSASAFYPPKSYFTIAHFNLYTHARLTDTLNVLSELRFSFLPQGLDRTYEYAGLPAAGIPSEGIFGNAYTRESTQVTDPTTTFQFNQGGVTIERLHLTYSPREWFNVLVGRFLTPFGIWNIEHGSPTVMSIGLPDMLIREMMPLAQTGLQVFGRFFPIDRMYLDYAVTLSNGRGPLESYADLDENKSVGLRLRMAYRGDNFSLSAGLYGYTGRFTDTKKVVHVLGLSSEATPDMPLSVDTLTTDSYDEYSISSDFLLEAFGVRLQAEYAYRYVDQLTNAALPSDFALFLGASPFDQLFMPSVKGQDVYVLVAYTLPLHKWIGSVSVTPYFMFEYGNPIDIVRTAESIRYRGGINVKPSPYVTLKVEGVYLDQRYELISGDLIVLQTQMAVSF